MNSGLQVDMGLTEPQAEQMPRGLGMISARLDNVANLLQGSLEKLGERTRYIQSEGVSVPGIKEEDKVATSPYVGDCMVMLGRMEDTIKALDNLTERLDLF